MFLVIPPSELAGINPPLEPPPVQIATEGKLILVTNRAAP